MVLALALVARAGVPLPLYPNCTHETLDQCPSDLREHDWDNTSWVPDLEVPTIRPEELDIGSGIGMDRVIQKTTGDFSVPIAFLDSGIDWSESQLWLKIRLSEGELPFPRDGTGSDSATYDLDGNGIFNLADYADDPRVTDDGGDDPFDGYLDPSDVINAFSDGTDDDGNGYVDDIAGWDFFEWDNDPWSDAEGSFADHGTGVMEEAAASGDDGGTLGVCPNCSVIPLRVGDGIIDDGERVGLAIAYAVDSGAKSVSMPLGALQDSDLTRAAVTYAENHGTVLVGAAGDENSFHHNFPAMTGHILYVHSIRADTLGEDEPGVYSYLSFYNCNNYGPRLDLVAPSNACATGATAKTAGAAGLLAAYGDELGLDLTPAEIRALLRMNADDIALDAADLAITQTYPSQPGWDAFYGAGRLNLGNAVDDLSDAHVPPLVSIDGPGWFAFSPKSGALTVSGRVSVRSGSVSWTVEAGQGAEPTSWTEIASGSGSADGVLAEIDPDQFPAPTFTDLGIEDTPARMTRAHEPLIMVRVTATDDDGVVSVDRRGFWGRPDPDSLPGFPFDLGSSSESTPQVADLDGDQIFEIIAAGGDGRIHALKADGSELPGFPVRTDEIAWISQIERAPAFASGELPRSSEGVIGAPGVGDIDGDGAPEIVITTVRGGVFAWHADGTRVNGFPVRIVGRSGDETRGRFAWDNGIYAAPALGDVDGDGALEIVVGGLDQRLYAWDGTGNALPGFPMVLCDRCDEMGARIVSSAGLGDVDGDGDLDAVLGTNEVPVGSAGLLFAVDLGTATLLPGFPMEREGLINQAILPVIGEGHPSSIALAQLGDGADAIASNAMLGSDGMIDAQGNPVLDVTWVRQDFGPDSNAYTDNAFLAMITNPAVGDLDADGVPDLAWGGDGPQYLLSLAGSRNVRFDHAVLAWNGATGAMFPGFPRALDDVSFLVAPAIADISGDGVPEVIYGTGGYLVYGWDKDGNLATGFPKHSGGWVLGGISVGDVDGDGYVDAVVGTREGWISAWSTKGRADQDRQWAGVRHDPQNTGNYGTVLPRQPGPPEVDEKGGCCKNRGETDSAMLVPIAFLVAFARRRRV